MKCVFILFLLKNKNDVSYCETKGVRFYMCAVGVKTDLESILNQEKIEEKHEAGIYGNGADMIVYPTTEEEISQILKYAHDNRKKIVIEGNGSKRGFGGTVETYDICLSLRDYCGIVEHAAGDMTVTVKAGTPFQEVQTYLKKENQRISMDPYSLQAGTVGGIIASNDSGPRRLSYGSARDSVIGMRVIYPDGTCIRCGGKVVKNVAGYDMNKLFIGSMGTLAVVTEVTFKTKPTAKFESVMCITAPEKEGKQLKDLAIRLLDSVMEPISLQYVTCATSKKLLGVSGPTLVVSFEDVESSVHYEENFVKSQLSKDAQVVIKSQQDAEQFWLAMMALAPIVKEKTEDENHITVAMKIGVKNLDVIDIMEYCEVISYENQIEIHAHGGLGHGLCEVYLTGKMQQVIDNISRLAQKAEVLGGHYTIKHAPLSVRRSINTWQKHEGTFALMQGIKKACDPNGILNEKRFVGGI